MYTIILATSIANSDDVSSITDHLNKIIGQSNWTIDLTDSENIMRIVAKEDNSLIVIKELQQLGFQASVLGIF
jgi:hypothetical protein